MRTSTTKPAQLKQELLESVKERIGRVRGKKGITQAEAAEFLGMTQPRLSALVQGHLDLFSLEALIDVAAKLGMSVRLNVSRSYGSPGQRRQHRDRGPAAGRSRPRANTERSRESRSGV